ncbi:hypothetical protein PPM_4613 [Paenibacillus polymyxa M1]|nr:hypothetical protein PPM_4613 [Paenibacillus polymyxa M1]
MFFYVMKKQGMKIAEYVLFSRMEKGNDARREP